MSSCQHSSSTFLFFSKDARWSDGKGRYSYKTISSTYGLAISARSYRQAVKGFIRKNIKNDLALV